MKVINFFIGTAWFFLMTLGMHAQNHQSFSEQLGLQAIESLHELSSNKIKNIMQQAVRRYQNNPEAFADFLKVRDKDGCNILINTAIMHDPKRLDLVLDHFMRVLSEYPHLAIEVLNVQDNHGKTVLTAAADRRHFEAITKLISCAEKIFMKHKSLFFDFIMLPTFNFQWNILMIAAFQSQSRIIDFVLKRTQVFFGSEKDFFEKFINSRDIYGRSPMALVIDAYDRLLFSKYDAQEHKGITNQKEYVAIKALGQQLLNYVSHLGHEQDVRNLLLRAKKMFNTNKRDYLFFITTRDEAGWTAVMNAAADGHASYIGIIFDALIDFFNNDQVAMLLLTATDIQGRAALHLAIQRRHLPVVKQLLIYQQKLFGNNIKEFMWFINERDKLNGFTPLLLASEISSNDDLSFSLIQLLVNRALQVVSQNSFEFNSFLNAKDLDKRTALMYANSKKIASFLRKHGAR